ncbi:hypothetical protein BDV96DRAFT_605794 [Lophiotrema nucula]|uniref:Fungal N-terminal domain-containing protein n=1 Tax=Lophiotrema nucula TaxID=690887 RepID=A0A6A5YMA1_9PLEO|nr:hypothetical protein BDV96DRAFT_605794 [Lophiotrema nucula]
MAWLESALGAQPSHVPPQQSYNLNVHQAMDQTDILSLVANFAGILTFAFALGASITACYALTANALREIDRLHDEWDNASKEVLLLHRYWHSEKLQGNAELERHLRDMQPSMDALAETALSIYRELKSLQPALEDNQHLFSGLRRRTMWTWRRQDVLDKMAEFGRRRQGLIHMQLGVLLTKSISQSIDSRTQKDLLTTLSVSYGTNFKKSSPLATIMPLNEVNDLNLGTQKLEIGQDTE